MRDRLFVQDDKLVHQTTFDPTANIESARALRLSGVTGNSDYRHVARIDKRLLHHLLVEAGIKWTDTEAVRDFIDRRLQDGTLSALRVHEGTF